MKINTRLMIMVSGLVFITLLLISAIVFMTYKVNLDENLKKQAVTQSALIRAKVDAWFSPFFMEVKALSYAAVVADVTSFDLVPLLTQVQKQNPDISDVYWVGEIAYKDGGYFRSASGWVPPKDYDQYARPWFANTRKTSGMFLTDPYMDMITKKLVVTVSANVASPTGEKSGVVGLDLFITKVGEIVNAEKISGNGKSFLVSADGKYVTNERAEAILAESIRDLPELKSVADTILTNEDSFGYTSGSRYYYSSVKFGSANWIFVTYGPLSDIYAELGLFLFRLVIAGLAALVVSVFMASFVARSIALPIGKAVAVAREISEGELRNDIAKNLLSRSDEIGILSAALQHMKENLSQVIAETISVADQVSVGSQQLSSTSQQMSQGATEQASSVDEISSSMEEMTANIKQNADNAMQTERIAQKSASAAENGGRAVAATVNAMKEIAAKIGIIEEIARSTNMLALNASIEAARAGEYGKGFAVVAAEVGKLAERSQNEAGEISKLSSESVKIAEQAGETISALIPDIKRTAELVQEISAASNEQNSGADQINSAIMQLDKVVQQNASASEESASMSEELAGQAEQMQSTMKFFKINTDKLRGGNE